jgi:phospholipid-binding lipoprotein MlaA
VTSSRRLAAVLVALVLLASCAARRPDAAEHDPWEGLNRKMFVFNDKLDVYALEPAATGWSKVTPLRLRTSISNFFSNLRFPIVTANDLLQGKVLAAGNDIGRFAVNTTVGVLGFFDPASGWGLERRDEDFGQTLGVWGVPSGPYLVIPLLGPSTVRDAAGQAVDVAFAVTPWFVDTWILVAARMFDAVDERSLYLQEVRDAKRSALDYYTFVRNAYLQRRHAQLQDSAVNVDNEEELYHPEIAP